MDMLNILIISVVFTMTVFSFVGYLIAEAKEKRLQIKLEETRRMKNRKRTVKFFCEQGEWLKDVTSFDR